MAQKLIVEIIGDSSQYERTLRRTAQQTKKFDVQMKGIGRSVGVAAAGFYGVQGLINGFETSVSAASNLNEQVAKSRQVFGRSASDIRAWSRSSATAMGLASDKALEAASSFGALMGPLGIGGTDAASQSKRLVQLGADLASFYNTDVADALDAIRSGLVGESEPLRRYGVLLSEARVKAEAMAETGKKNADQLTDTDKVLARIALTFKDTTKAQGDFARTGEGAANQMRILDANARNAATAIGGVLLPVLNEAAKGMNFLFANASGGRWSFDKAVEFAKQSRGDFSTTGDTGGGGTIGGPPTSRFFFNAAPPGGAAAAGRQAYDSAIRTAVDFMNKWTAFGTKWDNWSKAQAARRARQALQRQRFAAGLENQWGWLEFGLERAQSTKTLADDRRILKKQEQWLLNRISHAGRTLELTRKLWNVRQQIRDLNKKKASDGDPLAGLMQVSSKQMAGILAAGTGLGAYGRNILAANIAGQEIHIYNHLDGREVSRSVTRHQAGAANRTSAQTSGRRG